MSAGRDFSAVVEDFFPFDGPHSQDSVVGAALGAAALVRYVNNATRPGNGEWTLEWAAAVYGVVGGVHAVVAGLDQLLGQLVVAVRRQAGDPSLYDDRGDRSAAGTAREVAESLGAARQRSRAVAAELEAARAAASHLGNRLE